MPSGRSSRRASPDRHRKCADHRRISPRLEGTRSLVESGAYIRFGSARHLGPCAPRYNLIPGREAPTCPASEGVAAMPEKPPETGSCEVQPHNLLPAAAEISPFECAACDETWPPPDLNLAARSRNLVSEERARAEPTTSKPKNPEPGTPRKVASAGGASSTGPSSHPGNLLSRLESVIYAKSRFRPCMRSGPCRVNLVSDQRGMTEMPNGSPRQQQEARPGAPAHEP